ncbi:MAG: BatD family protein [Pseudomonadota bacterium]
MVNRITTVLLLLCCTAARAELRVFADPQSLDETETLRLTLRLEGRSRAAAPDLSPLEQDFEVLGSSNSSQYRSVNGQVRAWVEYQISLRPRRSGQLVVPSLELGNERSNPLTIDVRPLDPALKRSIDEMVFFETEVSPDPVYVQGELRVTRRLYYSTSGGVQMYTDLPGAPEIADAVVVTLGDAASFATERNGIEYGVVEQRFGVFPEASGTLTIPEVALTTSVRVLKNGRMRRSGVRVRSEAITVTVLSIPPGYPADQPWLPATSVRLSQTLSPTGDLATGSTAQLKITAAVTGNVASAIAPIDIAIPADRFREYPQSPSTTDEVIGKGIVGTRVQELSLVALNPGTVILEGPVLTWWNTRTGRVEQTAAEPLALTLTGAPVADAPAVTSADDDGAAAARRPQAAVAPPATATPAARPVLIGIAAAVALGLLWVARRSLLSSWRWPMLRDQPRSEQSRRREARGRLQRLLTQAESATAGDPQAAAAVRRGLLQALAFSKRETETAAAARLQQTQTGAEVLSALDALAYRGGAATVRVPGLDAVLRAFDEATVANAVGDGNATLPPLYPAS